MAIHVSLGHAIETLGHFLCTLHLDRITAGVTDGIETVGHTCCSVHDCKISLTSPRDRFCPAHDDMKHQCCINKCFNRAEDGYLTCGEPLHRSFQKHRDDQRTAMFQLRRRLERAGATEVPAAGCRARSINQNSVEDVDPSESQQPLDDNSTEEKVKGRMSRRWTHNEQLFVRCCGVILSRATFFGSEGVSGVKVSIAGRRPSLLLLKQKNPGLLEGNFSAAVPWIPAIIYILR
jgi:hypothetical protein